jgi:hypothetical protein
MTIKNTTLAGLGVGLGLVALAAPLHAEQFGPLEVSGFAKEEFSVCDNCVGGLVNPSSFDPRGALGPQGTGPALNQGAPSSERSSNLGLVMLTLGLSHEFDNATKIEAKASARERNDAADIFGQYLIDAHVGIAHPTYGELDVGILPSRSWSRTDSFAYPIGLSTSWAESGAGYGVFKQAIRYASPAYEFRYGKISFEASYATAPRREPPNYDSLLAQVTPANSRDFFTPPKPRLGELFIQYSNAKNLVELIAQRSSGGYQSSFTKGAFTGSEGSPNALQCNGLTPAQCDATSPAPGYQTPTEDVIILEGNYYYNTKWRITYGVKRNEWSGQQQQCDYGPLLTPTGQPNGSGCFWDQGGFNYASDGLRHHAIEYDYMAGVAFLPNPLWAYTFGVVRMTKAYTRTPTEYGQDNTATFLNLGAYRAIPEIYRNMQIYGGIGRTMFGRQGPAPLSMPNNAADGAVDPRTSKSGNHITIGANVNF